MSITFLSHPIHLPDFSMFDREYLGKQESQNEDQKVFHKDTLEVSQLSKNRENLMDKIICKASGKKLYHHLWIYTHGIATLCATKMCRFTDEEISTMITEVCMSILKKLKEGENND